MTDALKRCANFFLEKLTCGPLQKCGDKCQWVSTWSSSLEDCGSCSGGYWKGNWTKSEDTYLVIGPDVNEEDAGSCVISGGSGTCYGQVYSEENCPSTPDVELEEPPPLAAPDQCFCDFVDPNQRRAWIYCWRRHRSPGCTNYYDSGCTAENLCSELDTDCYPCSGPLGSMYCVNVEIVDGPFCVGQEAQDALDDCEASPPC